MVKPKKQDWSLADKINEIKESVVLILLILEPCFESVNVGYVLFSIHIDYFTPTYS